MAGRYAEAIDDCAAALHIDAKFHKAHSRMGSVCHCVN